MKIAFIKETYVCSLVVYSHGHYNYSVINLSYDCDYGNKKSSSIKVFFILYPFFLAIKINIVIDVLYSTSWIFIKCIKDYQK